jgi:hypothetical protein
MYDASARLHIYEVDQTAGLINTFTVVRVPTRYYLILLGAGMETKNDIG